MKSLQIVCQVSLLLGAVTAAHARPVHHATRPAPGITQVLQGIYNQADAAMARKDLAGAYRSCSPDMVVRDPSGREYDINTMRRHMSSILPLAQSISGKTRIVSAAQHGATATVTAKGLNVIVVKNPQTGQTSTLADRMTSRDEWSKASGRWLMMRSQILSETGTLDGHPITVPAQ